MLVLRKSAKSTCSKCALNQQAAIASISRSFKGTASASSVERVRPFGNVLHIFIAGITCGSSQFLHRVSVSCRRHMSNTSEMTVEVSQIGKSHLIRDHTYRCIALHQPHASPPDPQPAKIIAHTFAYMLHKQPMQRARRQISDFAQLRDTDGLVKSLVQAV